MLSLESGKHVHHKDEVLSEKEYYDNLYGKIYNNGDKGVSENCLQLLKHMKEKLDTYKEDRTNMRSDPQGIFIIVDGDAKVVNKGDPYKK